MNDEATRHRPKRGGGRAYHSRLESFVDYIREQRQRRRTWKEIAESLRADKGCSVTLQAVHQFYRRYVQRSRKPHWETQLPLIPAPETAVPTPKTVQAETPPARPFRRPSVADLTLNNPLNV